MRTVGAWLCAALNAGTIARTAVANCVLPLMTRSETNQSYCNLFPIVVSRAFHRVHSLMSPYLVLGIAIVCEVIATSFLKLSNGFSQWHWTAVSLFGYAVSFYFLAQTLKAIPTGIAYAIWSGVGIVLISLTGWLLFKQKLDTAALLGMGLIVAGVLVINVFSSSVHH